MCLFTFNSIFIADEEDDVDEDDDDDDDEEDVGLANGK